MLVSGVAGFRTVSIRVAMLLCVGISKRGSSYSMTRVLSREMKTWIYNTGIQMHSWQLMLN
jgi:hypothetical protein